MRGSLSEVVAVSVAAVLAAGCVSTREIQVDAVDPSIRVTERGFLVGKEYVDPVDIPDILEDSGVRKTETIHILIEPGVERDLRPASALMAYLAKCGYTRPMLVTERHAESEAVKSRPRAPVAPAEPKIRYKH